MSAAENFMIGKLFRPGFPEFRGNGAGTDHRNGTVRIAMEKLKHFIDNLRKR